MVASLHSSARTQSRQHSTSGHGATSRAVTAAITCELASRAAVRAGIGTAHRRWLGRHDLIENESGPGNTETFVRRVQQSHRTPMDSVRSLRLIAAAGQQHYTSIPQTPTGDSRQHSSASRQRPDSVRQRSNITRQWPDSRQRRSYGDQTTSDGGRTARGSRQRTSQTRQPLQTLTRQRQRQTSRVTAWKRLARPVPPARERVITARDRR